MPDQPSAESPSQFSPDQIAEAVLSLLLDAHPGLLNLDDLIRRFAGLGGDLTQARVWVEDGLSDLIAHGLVHRLDRFVFASPAATRAAALLECP